MTNKNLVEERNLITLRNFTDNDAIELQQKCCVNMSLDEIKARLAKWQEKKFEGKYFEMFAVIKGKEIVGMISLYQHSETVISCGPETFECFRKQGIAGEAMLLAMEIAKSKGYKLVSQQIRVNNTASIALHKKLGFETDEYIYQNQKGNHVQIFTKLL
ncbi:MAG: GNAT family N-acetyltransferase [Clostridia bacterium]|nr:GNAT family N-acetyltransferase [Clostridia bacterium]